LQRSENGERKEGEKKKSINHRNLSIKLCFTEPCIARRLISMSQKHPCITHGAKSAISACNCTDCMDTFYSFFVAPRQMDISVWVLQARGLNCQVSLPNRSWLFIITDYFDLEVCEGNLPKLPGISQNRAHHQNYPDMAT
jgi:hypothetical protein